MKKVISSRIFFIAVIILALILVSLSITVLPSKVYSNSYSVGDIGPAGGYIFYVSGSSYLECAPNDQGTAPFSNITDQLIGTTGTAVGTGQANTNAIIAQSGHTASAAQVCADYSNGSYGDWFLPSIDELNLMYTNLYLASIGNFSSGWYRSSSEYNATRAWEIHFSNGTPVHDEKYWSDNVRPIRAFTMGGGAPEADEPEPWVRGDRDMVCHTVFVNDNGCFEFVFHWEYADNNWVSIFETATQELAFQIDMPYGDPTFEACLEDNTTYTVFTHRGPLSTYADLENEDNHLQMFMVSNYTQDMTLTTESAPEF